MYSKNKKMQRSNHHKLNLAIDHEKPLKNPTLDLQLVLL